MLKLFILAVALNAGPNAPVKEFSWEPGDFVEYGTRENPIFLPEQVTPAMCGSRVGLKIAEDWALEHPGYAVRGVRCKLGSAATEKGT